MFSRELKRPGLTLPRFIGALLVVFILYGTTVEAAHKHGRFLATTNNTVSISETGSSDGSLGNKSGCNDCLICQLHQNFSTAVTANGLISPSAEVHNLVIQLDPVTITSRINTPQTGRAPPKKN